MFEVRSCKEDLRVKYKHVFDALEKTSDQRPLRFICDLVYIIAIDAEWYESLGKNVVLSYQIATACRDRWNNIIQYVPEGHRLTLAELVELGIRLVNGGKMPESHRSARVAVIVVSHNIAAEWSVLADRDEPHIVKRLALVRKSPITDGHAIKITLERRFPVRVLIYDTMLLAPVTHRSLAKLSELLGEKEVQKIPIKQREIEHMDQFLREDPERYEAYALRDSEACLKLFLLLQDALNRLAYGEGQFRKLFRTLASAGVEGFLKRRENEWFPIYLECLGLAIPPKKRQHRERILEVAKDFAEPYKLIRRAYHGGRNESFFVGRTSEFDHTRDKVWVDIDFSGCYPTAMALCPRIDLAGEILHLPLSYRIDEEKAAQLIQEGVAPELVADARSSLEESLRAFDRFLHERTKSKAQARKIREKALDFDNRLIDRWVAMSRQTQGRNPESYLIPGFARIQFSFPEGAMYPCLPVKHYRYGLIYPLSGETVATAAEILLALEAGATIRALTSVELPIANAPRSKLPFTLSLPDPAVPAHRTPGTELIPLRPVEGEPHRFFMGHLREVLRQRAEYKARKEDLSAQIFEKLLKEFANSFYGKFAQAINSRNTYRPATGEMVPLGRSTLTEPCVAALSTGLARAALSATLLAIEEYNRDRSVEERVTVVSATTDGLLVGLPCPPGYSVEADYYVEKGGVPRLKSEVKRSKEEDAEAKAAMEVSALFSRFGCSQLLALFEKYLPVRQMIHSRIALTGANDFLEVKHLVDEVVSVKTRGQIGLLASKHVPLLARFGHKPPLSEKIKDPEEYKRVMEAGGAVRNTVDAEWILERLSEIRSGREEIETYTFITLTSFRKMIESEGEIDLTKHTRPRKINADYDWKRKIVAPHIPETEPFSDLSEMLKYRGHMEAIRRTGRVARPEKVLHRVAVKSHTVTRERGGPAITMVRHFLRGVLQGHIPLAEKLGRYRTRTEQLNSIWQRWGGSASKVWSVDDFKNARRPASTWDTGVLLPDLALTDLLEELCRAFGADLEKAASYLFSSAEHRLESASLVQDVARAILQGPRQGIEPFRTLFLDGRLPERAGILATFRPILTEALLAECASGAFMPACRYPREREKLVQLFRRVGLTLKEARNCARVLCPPSPARRAPRRNPAQRRCLEHFVLALHLPDVSPAGMRPTQILDRLGRFGLTKRQLYALRKSKFTAGCLNDTPENRKQIERMAKSLHLDPVPFLDALIDH